MCLGSELTVSCWLLFLSVILDTSCPFSGLSFPVCRMETVRVPPCYHWLLPFLPFSLLL